MSQFPPPPAQPTPPLQPPAPAPMTPAVPKKPRKYSYFAAIVLSFFSKDLWVDVGRRWRGVGILYMLLVLVITWLAVLGKGYVGFSHFLKNDAPKMVEQLPAINITNGVVSIDKPSPYYIKEPDKGQIFAMIDTSGRTTTPPAGVMLLLTQNKLIQRQSANEIRTHDLSQVKSFTLNKQDVYRWIDIARVWFVPVTLPFMVVVTLVVRIVFMVILAAVGIAIASAFKAPLDYAALMRLSAVAMTPGLVLATVLSVAGISIPGCFDTFLWLGMTVLFLTLSIKANSLGPTEPGGFAVMAPGAPA